MKKRLLSTLATTLALTMMASPSFAAKDIIITGNYKETEVYIKHGRGIKQDGNVYYRGIPCGNLFKGIDCLGQADETKILDALYNAMNGYGECKAQRDKNCEKKEN